MLKATEIIPEVFVYQISWQSFDLTLKLVEFRVLNLFEIAKLVSLKKKLSY